MLESTPSQPGAKPVREWIKHTSGYWGFGSFIIALLVLLGGAGYWAFDIQEKKLENSISDIEDSVDTTVSRLTDKIETDVVAVEEAAATMVAEVAEDAAAMEVATVTMVAAAEAGLSADISIVEDTADTNRDLITRLEARFDRMDAKIDRMDAKLDTLLTRLPPNSAN